MRSLVLGTGYEKTSGLLNMDIFILRHGEAESNQQNIDAQRQLTDIGRQQTQDILSAHADYLTDVHRIITSPYVRAQQTAEIARSLLNLSEEGVFIEPCLKSNGDLSEVLKMLDSQNERSVLISSHQPLVGSLVNLLTQGVAQYLSMSTSSLAFIQTDYIAPGCGELKWLVAP